MTEANERNPIYVKWIKEAAQAMRWHDTYRDIEPCRGRFWYIQTFKYLIRALEVSHATILEAAMDAYIIWKDGKKGNE